MPHTEFSALSGQIFSASWFLVSVIPPVGVPGVWMALEEHVTLR